MSDTITITIPEDAKQPGPIAAVDPKTGAPERLFVRLTFAEHIAERCADPGYFGADLHARRIGHAIRDVFAGKKEGDKVELPRSFAQLLFAACEKPTGGYQAAAGYLPTSWLFAVPDPSKDGAP